MRARDCNIWAQVLRKRPKFTPLVEQADFMAPYSGDLKLRDYQLAGVNWMMRAWTKLEIISCYFNMCVGVMGAFLPMKWGSARPYKQSAFSAAFTIPTSYTVNARVHPLCLFARPISCRRATVDNGGVGA
jgi:hypothetical protein